MSADAATTPLRCPKCRESPLAQVDNRATRLLRCGSCQGTWLPSDEARIEAVRGLMEGDESMLPGTATDAITGLCPYGHGILIRARVDLDEPFYVERCSECAGIWFDRGEWNKLARGHLLVNLTDLWNPAVRWRAQKEKAEAAYREKLSGEIGEEALHALEGVAVQLSGKPEKVKMAALAYLREALHRLG